MKKTARKMRETNRVGGEKEAKKPGDREAAAHAFKQLSQTAAQRRVPGLSGGTSRRRSRAGLCSSPSLLCFHGDISQRNSHGQNLDCAKISCNFPAVASTVIDVCRTPVFGSALLRMEVSGVCPFSSSINNQISTFP